MRHTRVPRGQGAKGPESRAPLLLHGLAHGETPCASGEAPRLPARVEEPTAGMAVFRATMPLFCLGTGYRER